MNNFIKYLNLVGDVCKIGMGVIGITLFAMDHHKSKDQ